MENEKEIHECIKMLIEVAEVADKAPIYVPKGTFWLDELPDADFFRPLGEIEISNSTGVR